jgi:hypothetical protein
MGSEQSTSGYCGYAPNFWGRMVYRFIADGCVDDEPMYDRRWPPKMAADGEGFFDIGDGVLRHRTVVISAELGGYVRHRPRDRFVVVYTGIKRHRSKLLPKAQAEAFRCMLTGTSLTPAPVPDHAHSADDAPLLSAADAGPYCDHCTRSRAAAAATCVVCREPTSKTDDLRARKRFLDGVFIVLWVIVILGAFLKAATERRR